MATHWNAWEAQLIIPYQFQDLSLLCKALTAGDTNSDDREGHRGMAQVGDALINFVLMSEGFNRGLSRKDQQYNSSMFKSKAMCSWLARLHHIDGLVKISERQCHEGPQETTLKNALAAIVGAVWQESQNYGAVVKVMTTLGFINYAAPSISPHQLRRESRTPSGDRASDNGSGESDITTDEIFDACVHSDMLGPASVSATSPTNASGERLPADPLQDPNVTPGLIQVTGHDGAEEASFESRLVLDDPTPETSLAPGSTVGHAAATTSQTASTARGGDALDHSNWNINDDRLGSISSNPLQTNERSMTDVRSSRSKASTTIRPSGTKSLVRRTFDKYLTNEARKLKNKHGLFESHYKHMYSYREALSSIRTPRPKALADMAVAIGDWSAMFLLKQAIQNIHSSSAVDLFHVARDMSQEERLRAIHRLSACMAHLRLARWLHIYMLYEEAFREVGGKDADGFIVVTNTHLHRSSKDPRTVAPLGNPRNLERTNITRRMTNSSGGGGGGSSDRGSNNKSGKNLRLIGERLHLFVNKWGLGILPLLGVTFSDDLIVAVSNTAFSQFIDTVDHFEGRSIRMVSETAEPVVQLFMDDSDLRPTLQLEVVGEDTLELLPRLSPDMQALFHVASGS